MKILIIILMLLSPIAFSEEIKNVGRYSDVYTVCVKGYLFVVVEHKNGSGITQIFEPPKYRDQAIKPIRCEPVK